MIYLAEVFYWREQKDFPFRAALEVTVQWVGEWCGYYLAEILAPRDRSQRPLRRQGPLPAEATERASFLGELVGWLLDSSLGNEPLRLLLDDQPIVRLGSTPKLAFYDSVDTWTLNLSEEEFSRIQALWSQHGLPTDLFYPQSAGVCVPWPGRGFGAKLLRLLGVQKCYTPKQWEREREFHNG